MDLLDRYLAAIRRNLPRDRADDIVDELADELESRREEREHDLGRPLTPDETSAMLRSFGHPLTIAARYRSHQYLIGPQVFPFYQLVMKVVLAIGGALLIAAAGIGLLLQDRDLLQTLLQMAGDLWLFFLAAMAIVTFIFAMLERQGFPADHLARWRPEQLPDLTDRPQSHWESALEIGFGIAFLLWWIGAVTLPSFGGNGMRIAAAPVWDAFFHPILALMIVQLALNVMKLVRPRWKTAQSLLTIVTSAATLVIVAGVYRAGKWIIVEDGASNSAATAEIEASVNLALEIALAVVAVLMILQALGELWKLVRTTGGRTAARRI
ncbi:hypothetical protein E2493_19580 [Sphingomonas parva]|uniref:Uncharacterized protein n=1 Tax=Sphingomonas parva TaxID=2555898 RepID=A0A4Y8ZKL2_9SPHN|nr:hypothetical protein [Sphingomonas parva]TFI56543.1 hypothetical protein E2493_19580 [Sphingomonas parva]